MNKKWNVSLYYISFTVGILLINYVLKIHPEYAENLLTGIEEIEKMSFVNGQELFWHLLLKRMKQMLFFFLLYFHISQPLTLLFLRFYFSCMAGIVLSLFAFMKGLLYMIVMGFLLLPHFVCFLVIEKAGWNYYQEDGFKRRIDMTNVFIFVFSVTILLIIIEMHVNLLVNKIILNYI